MSNETNASLGICSIKLTTEKYIDQANDAAFTSIFLPSFIFTLIMFLIGGPGNSLVFYVYFAKWRKTTARTFILALAAFDMINCFFTMPMELAVLKNIIRFESKFACKIFRYVTFMMNNGSSVVLAGIAIDRYIRICMPLRPQLQPKHAKIVIVVAVFLSILFAWPALILYGIQTVPIPLPGKPYICLIGKTCLYEEEYIHSDYPLMFTLVLLIGNIVIDVGLISCYVKIGYQVIKRGTSECSHSMKMRKASSSTLTTDDNHVDDQKEDSVEPEQRPLKKQSSVEKNEKKTTPEKSKWSPTKQSSASKKRDMFRQRSVSVSSIEARRSQMYKTTFMLFMVTLLFMGSFIPYCVIVIIRTQDKDYYTNLSQGGKTVYNLFLRFYMLSSSLNPVIYCFMSVQFRKLCKDLFNQLRCRRSSKQK